MRIHFFRFVFAAEFATLVACQPSIADHPAKVAGFVQLDITGDASIGRLDKGMIVRGTGWMDRMTWLPEGAQMRSYTAGITINRLTWTRAGFEFTPKSNGVVIVSFSGPWEEVAPGQVWRQEVAIDEAETSGGATPFLNGGFETHSNGTPTDWTWSIGPGEMNANDPPPYEGNGSAIVWTDSTLSQSVTVTGGVPVRIWVYARARTPHDFVDQPRLPSSGTPAHKAVINFMRGVNLGNALEAPPDEDWGAHYTNADFDAIVAQGFDHVRIPAGWHYHAGAGPAYTISNAFFDKVDALVTNALSRGLHAIVNIHHFHEFTSNPAAGSDKFHVLWEQIAEHYSGIPNQLTFELLNEPTSNATTVAMNPIYAEAIARIRAISPARTIFVGPGDYNSIAELDHLVLPPGDSNLVVTVHDYAPFYFTHQGTPWTQPDTATTNIVYPGPPATPVEPHPDTAGNAGVAEWLERYNRLETGINPCSRDACRDALAYARAWADYYGRPIHVGEWGCYRMIDSESRARFHREKREDLDANLLPWALWDWKAEFRYWEPAVNAPVPGLREATLPAPVIRQPDRWTFSASGSIGRRYRWETTDRLTGDVQWEGEPVKRLDGNAFERKFEPLGSNRCFRVRWLLP